MKNKDIALTDAQRSMVEANMDVVRWAIRTSIQVNEQRYGFGYDDLFQEGCIASIPSRATPLYCCFALSRSDNASTSANCS